MFSNQLAAAIAAIESYAQADALGREIAIAWGNKLIDDDAAGVALEAVELRRKALRDNPRPQFEPRRRKGPPRARRPRSSDREASIRRRRRCSDSGAMPPQIRERFTEGERAAIAVIVREIRRRKFCDLCIDQIAAQSGVCRTVVQNALREAKLGLMRVQERPRPGQKNLTNIITVICPLWRAWLKLDGDRVQNSKRHEYQKIKTFKVPENRSVFGSAQGGGGEMTRLDRALARSEAILAEKWARG